MVLPFVHIQPLFFFLADKECGWFGLNVLQKFTQCLSHCKKTLGETEHKATRHKQSDLYLFRHRSVLACHAEHFEPVELTGSEVCSHSSFICHSIRGARFTLHGTTQMGFSANSSIPAMVVPFHFARHWNKALVVESFVKKRQRL